MSKVRAEACVNLDHEGASKTKMWKVVCRRLVKLASF